MCDMVFKKEKDSCGAANRTSDYVEKVMKNFVKFTRENLGRSLFFDIVRHCRSVISQKMRLQHRYFLLNFAKLVRKHF